MMARRESQGLQIALIIFIMVTVVLAVTTFFFYRQSEEKRKAAEAAQKDKDTAKSSYDKENLKVQYLKHVLGIAPLSKAEADAVRQQIADDPAMKSVDDAYQQHVSAYGVGLPPEQLNYVGVLRAVGTALKDRNSNNADLASKEVVLNEEKKKLQEDEAKRTGEALASLQKAKSDLDAQTQSFTQVRDDLTKRQETQLATFKKSLDDFQSQLAAAKQTDDVRQGEVKKMQTTIDDMRERITKMQDEPFEVPDGQIAWVNQRMGKAWVNLGTADGLRRQTLFSVFDQQDNGVTRAERKASIEVTRVLNEHLAEARIVSDSPSNPILPGDQVFSPTWRPGRLVHFALAGKLDIDGDRVSDRERIRSLIESSGGAIDAEVTETGDTTGALTSETRYLVVGEQPDHKSDAKAIAAWTQIRTDAEQRGVEVIQLEKLLTWMGYKSEVRTIPLGRGSASQAGKAPEASPPATSAAPASDATEEFRERRPPDRGKADSAF